MAEPPDLTPSQRQEYGYFQSGLAIQADKWSESLLTGEQLSVPESGLGTSSGTDAAAGLGSLPFSSSMMPHYDEGSGPQTEYDVRKQDNPRRNYLHVPSRTPPLSHPSSHHHITNEDIQNEPNEASELIPRGRNNFSSAFDKKHWMYGGVIVVVLVFISLVVGLTVGLPLYFTDPCDNIKNSLSVFSTDTVVVTDVNPACNKLPSVSLSPDDKFPQLLSVYQTDSCDNLIWYNTSFSMQPEHYANISTPLLVFEHTDDISNYLSTGARLNITINATVSVADALLYVCVFDNKNKYLIFEDDWTDNLNLAKHCATHNLSANNVTVVTEQFLQEENGYYLVAITTTASQFDIVEYSYRGFNRYLNHSDYTYTDCELPDATECRPTNSCVLLYAQSLTPGVGDFSFLQVQASKLETTARGRYSLISGSVVVVSVFVALALVVIVLWKFVCRSKQPTQETQ